MALEFVIVRADKQEFTCAEIERATSFIKGLSSFVFQDEDRSIWLKTSTSSWEFDVRIFAESDKFFFEQSLSSDEIWRAICKIRDFFNSEISPVLMLDEDGDEL